MPHALTRLAAGAAIAALLVLPPFATGAAPPPDAATFVVAEREVPQAFAAEGVVEAVRQATVGAQVAGRILDLGVKAGDSVRAGQVLARIDSRAAEQALAASRSQVAEAEANLANARMKHDRNRQLLAQKFVSQAAVDQSEAEYRAAVAQLDAAKANAAQAAAHQSYGTIAAPFAGVVGATLAEAGDMAVPGKPIVTVFDPADLRVVATLPQATLPQWKRDAPLSVEVPALSRTLAPVRVTLVPIADARAHTVRVRLDLPPTPGLLPGQFARAHFPTGTVRALTVPASALLRRGELLAVYVAVAGGAPRLRQVRIGETFADGTVEILAGVVAGERVYVNPIAAGTTLASSARP